MTIEQALLAALGGSPVALVVAIALKVVWGKYQEALDAIRDRDAEELQYLKSLIKGESQDG